MLAATEVLLETSVSKSDTSDAAIDKNDLTSELEPLTTVSASNLSFTLASV